MSVEYIEVTIVFSPFNQDLADLLIADLGELGYDSFTEQPNGFTAYIPSSLYNEENIAATLACYKQDAMVSMQKSTIAPQNWNAVWESNFDPILVDSQCLIRAPFHTSCQKAEMEVVIEPKMSFGTGHHDTTYLMAEWLLAADVKGKKVLDMGCGTGVLAIIAAKKQAAAVDAIDIDEWAYENSVENAANNGVSIAAMQGDATLLRGKTYDLVLANINRNILLQDMKSYVSSLNKDGVLVVSGILTEDIPTIENEAKRLGMKKLEDKHRNQWARIVFIK